MTEEEFNQFSFLLMGGAVVFLYASAASMLMGLMEKPTGKGSSTGSFSEP